MMMMMANESREHSLSTLDRWPWLDPNWFLQFYNTGYRFEWPEIHVAWYETLWAYFMYNYILIATACFGILSNLSVLIVFFKEGFVSTSTISFFSLALTDFYVCSYWAIRFTLNFLWDYLAFRNFLNFIHEHVEKTTDAMNMLGAWITTIITMERLCCIAFPIKVSLL